MKTKSRFDPAEGLDLLKELVRLTAPPAGEREISDQAIALVARAIGASAGVVLLRGVAGDPEPAAAWGRRPSRALLAAGRRALDNREDVEEPGRDRGAVARVALALDRSSAAIGAIAIEKPARWCDAARLFLRAATQLVAAALEAARTIRQAQIQGELLASRNVELETLRELGARLQEIDREEDLLQAALDLVLERLGLGAGWILWGDSEDRRLLLAASRGLSEPFVREASRGAIGTCLCQEVFETGRQMVARNTVDCPRLPEIVLGSESAAHACIPLKFQGGTLGVMNILARPRQLFTEQELRFLETIGSQICLAVDIARTTRGETRRNAEARALASLARAIGGSLEQGRVLAAVGDYARELLDADRCAILLGEEISRLDFAYLTGPPLEGLTLGESVDLLALDSKAFAQVLRDRHTLVLQDVESDPRANAELARRWQIGSQILVPLAAHGQIEGVLTVTRNERSTWTEDEVALADALGGQAAVAIGNARLYREAQLAFRKLQEAQDSMMRAERLAAVGTLAASLAHEVRNPLNSISLQLVLLSRRVVRLGEPLTGELSALIEAARGEIARLNTLVEEFLSLSSGDRLVLREEDPAEVVREVGELMRPAATEKAIELAMRASSAVPTVRMDREKMKQVLINLVRNAIEAMPEGGRLDLEIEPAGESVVVRVKDTGVGIDPGVDVFDLFVTTKSGGTGLGLPIAKSIVEAHGGTLTYESEPGRGASFSVTLKRPKALAAREEAGS